MSTTPVGPPVEELLRWFEHNGRDLPWRGNPQVWGVLVSEFMLQQTPVERVRPVWERWMQLWPEPSDLAAAPLAAALREWGRLGYPRRAARLHASASIIDREFGGQVPRDAAVLRSLPGVGEYTAAAVLSFGYGLPAVVLDVNVRRFLARYFLSQATVPGHVTGAERELAQALLPAGREPQWAAASMEFGQVICTARTPSCDICPVASGCRWLAAGRPGAGERTTKVQRYQGTDRQVRGLVLELLRQGPASRRKVRALWPQNPLQLDRAVDSLVADGLVDPVTATTLALPGDSH